MTSPLPLPDWVPWWANLAILCAGLLFALMFLLMPFAVFGVKSRLDLLEARLDEIQGEIRSLSLRLPEPSMGGSGIVPEKRRFAEPDGYPGPQNPGGYSSLDGHASADEYGGRDGQTSPRPPIPPAPRDRRPPVMPPRTEPRLY